MPPERPSSPAPSVSLLEIKAETRLVLGAFLRRTLSTPVGQRPGWVGGAYRDHKKFSASSKDDRCEAMGSKDSPSTAGGSKDGRSKAECFKYGRSKSEGSKDGRSQAEGSKDGRRKAEGDGDSLDSQSSSEGEKKHRFKNLLKKHLKARSSKLRLRDSQKKDGQHQEDVLSPYSSTSEDGSDGEEDKKKKKKKKKLKSPFSSIIRRMKSKKDTSNQDASNTTRPNSLVMKDTTDPVEPQSSPGHHPEFYAEVAETIDRFAMKHTLERQEPQPASSASSKEAVVQKLVRALQIQGDAINVRIQSSPFLRSSLANMSYPSFASLVETFTSQAQPPAPAPASPTLSRIAMTMEVSRRVITATGTHRIQGYAERYMEKFTPWVKRHGGWENILHSEEVLDYD